MAKLISKEEYRDLQETRIEIKALLNKVDAIYLAYLQRYGYSEDHVVTDILLYGDNIEDEFKVDQYESKH